MSPCVLAPQKPDADGYVRLRSRKTYAHRAAWVAVHGPIPEGFDVHHTCHARNCINVDHLELLTVVEHNKRHAAEKTHCPQGHPYDKENTYWAKSYGGPRTNRICRTCSRARKRRLRALVKVGI